MVENKTDEKEFEEKYDKIVKDFSKKFHDENSSKLKNEIVNDFKQGPDTITSLSKVIGYTTALSMNFSIQLMKKVLKEMLVDQK